MGSCFWVCYGVLMMDENLMYEINICSPIYDATQDGTVNLRATRILFGVDLLLLCLLHNFTAFFLKRAINDLILEDKQSNDSRIEQLQHEYKKWEQEYLLSMGDHLVAVGFVMCFSPYQFELILALVFVAAKIAHEIKLHKFNSNSKEFKTLFRLINMALLICAMVGLSRTSYDSDYSCADSTYASS